MSSCEIINFRGKEVEKEEAQKIIDAESKNLLHKTKSSEDIDGAKNFTARYDEILARISNMHSKFTPRNIQGIVAEETSRAAGEETPQWKLEKLLSLMKELNKQSTLAGMFSYVEYSTKELDFLTEEINNALLQETITSDIVKRVKEHLSVFDLMSYVRETVIEDYDKGVITDEHKNLLLQKLKDISGKHDQLMSRLNVLNKKNYVRIMSENSNQIVNDYRLKFEKEHAVFAPTEPILEYVNRRIEESKDEIIKASAEFYKDRAEKSNSDISTFASYIYTEKNMSSEEIQVASRIIDAADSAVDRFVQSKAGLYKTSYDDFNSDKKGTYSPEKKYKNLIDNGGNEDSSYLIGRYKSEFADVQSKLMREMNDPDIYNEKFKDTKIIAEGKAYVIDGKTFMFQRKDAKKIRVVGEELKYVVHGIQRSEPIKSAIARSEYKRWKLDNTEKVEGKYIPVKKWINEDYDKLSDKDRQTLDFLKRQVREDESLYKNKSGLIKTISGQEFIKLPSVTKTTVERLKGGKVGSAAIDAITDVFKKKVDDEDLGRQDSQSRKYEDGTVNALADVNNKEQLQIRIPFRGAISNKDQSYDLHTIFLMNSRAAKNYEQKSKIEVDLHSIADVLASRLVPNRSGINKVRKMHASSGYQLNMPDSNEPNDLTVLESILENRLYGIRQKSSAVEGELSPEKVVGKAMKYMSAVALVGNYANSMVNATTGTLNNLIEAFGGDVYNLKDWRVAKKKYLLDIKGIMGDLGSNIDTSRTNYLMNLFNVVGNRDYLNSNFENTSWLHNALKNNAARPLAKGGEHMMQAQVMYAVMNSIKITNKKGQYLNSDGKIVSKKSDAATIDEMIEFRKNEKTGEVEMHLNKAVKATSFSPDAKNPAEILLETRNLIKNRIINLHGLYDTDLQSMAQREWWGKLVFFLRKWMEPTINRRWRGMNKVAKASSELDAADRFYSQDLKQYQEGYYTTAIRLLGQILQSGRDISLASTSQEWKKLNKHEIANVRRFAAELGMIAMTVAVYALIGGYDDEEDEDTLFWRYVLRRELSELTFYLNPKETYKVASTPSASVSYIKKSLDLIEHILLEPGERYTTGRNKGESKVWVKTKKMMPLIGNTVELDLKSKMSFLQNAR